MPTSTLDQAYDPEEFRKLGHLLIDQLADHLEENIKMNVKTMPWSPPEDMYSKVSSDLWMQETDLTDFVLRHSIRLHNPGYIGHQISPTLPIAALASLTSALLNNGGAVFEMGMTATSLERKLIELYADRIGYDIPTSTGFLTSGGTLANLTAMLAARRNKGHKDVWISGGQHTKMAVMVSEQAHYCIDRAARIMGLGEKGIIKIPVTKQFSVDNEAIGPLYDKAISEGYEVIAIVGSACSTSTGSYDDLEYMSSFAAEKNLWFHVDGAHGGAVIFSEKYKPLVKGIATADSVVIDCHKMMMSPSIITALVYKNEGTAYHNFSPEAEYLFDSVEAREWYNLGKRTFECTKEMMSLKVYTIIHHYGTEILTEYVDTLYDKAKSFSEILKDDDSFELACEPMANIVCFRFLQPNDQNVNNQLQLSIRKALLEEGTYYIVQTKLNGRIYLRCTVMNPFTTADQFMDLLAKIKTIASSLYGSR